MWIFVWVRLMIGVGQVFLVEFSIFVSCENRTKFISHPCSYDMPGIPQSVKLLTALNSAVQKI